METKENMEQNNRMPVKALENVTNEQISDDTIDLIALALYLKKYLLLIIVGFLTGTCIMIYYTKNYITPQYQSSTSIFVYGMGTTIGNLSTNLSISSEMSEDYVFIATTHEITEKVISELGLDMTAQELASCIDVVNPSNTKILTITVTYPDPDMAAKISTSVGDAMRSRIADITDTDKPSVASTALVSTEPVSPNIKKNALIGGLVIACLIIAVLTVLFLLDDTIKTEEDVKDYLGLQVLVVLPIDHNLRRRRIHSHHRNTISRWKKLLFS